MDGKEILKEVLKNINIKNIILGVLMQQVIKPAILDFVAKSDNKLDDAAVALLLPLAEKSLGELLDQLLDGK